MRGFSKKLLVVLSILIVVSVTLYFYVTRYISITDNIAPQWKNQNQSKTWVLQGERVSLQADGRDNLLLRKAVLSTNETGVWRNETEYAFMWRQRAVFGFDNFGTATYEDGVLYAPSKGDNKVYAVNASNGNVIWNTLVRQCDASPYIDGDVIYVGECMGPDHEPIPFPKAMALNKTNGEVVWEFIEPNNSTWVGSPVVHGDYVYFTTYGSGVYALNKTNGTPIWHRDIGNIVCSVAYHNGMVSVSAYEPSGQYCFNATTEDTIWQKKLWVILGFFTNNLRRDNYPGYTQRHYWIMVNLRTERDKRRFYKEI